MELTGKEKRVLRARGSLQKPIVYLGKEGFSAKHVSFISDAFNTSELIKIKIHNTHPLDKETIVQEISDKLEDVSVVQIIGNNILLFRPFPDDKES